jgi:hypothetical protein
VFSRGHFIKNEECDALRRVLGVVRHRSIVASIANDCEQPMRVRTCLPYLLSAAACWRADL